MEKSEVRIKEVEKTPAQNYKEQKDLKANRKAYKEQMKEELELLQISNALRDEKVIYFGDVEYQKNLLIESVNTVLDVAKDIITDEQYTQLTEAVSHKLGVEPAPKESVAEKFAKTVTSETGCDCKSESVCLPPESQE